MRDGGRETERQTEAEREMSELEALVGPGVLAPAVD